MPPAIKLKTYKPTRKGGPKQKYPWDKWLDGNIYRLVRGPKGHFQCKVKTMEHLIRRQLAIVNNGRQKAGKSILIMSVFKEHSPDAIVIKPK